MCWVLSAWSVAGRADRGSKKLYVTLAQWCPVRPRMRRVPLGACACLPCAKRLRIKKKAQRLTDTLGESAAVSGRPTPME